jgi:hypothetical protein
MLFAVGFQLMLQINRSAGDKVDRVRDVNRLTKFRPKPSHRLGHFLFVMIFPLCATLLGHIMARDHSLGRNDIFKFVYCSMILFLIYHSVG